MADGYALELRRQAVKAFKAIGAGSNPLLKLSLSDDIANDLGFYQRQLCLRTFQRMLRKSPDLLVMWRIRMNGFDGKLLPGPFSRMLPLLAGVGCMITEPPFIMDHEQCTWNLMTLDGKTLQAILADAWLQYAGTTIQRHSMTGLLRIDGYLTLLHAQRLPSLQRTLLSALHSGAFMTSAEHSRYDEEKIPFCQLLM